MSQRPDSSAGSYLDTVRAYQGNSSTPDRSPSRADNTNSNSQGSMQQQQRSSNPLLASYNSNPALQASNNTGYASPHSRSASSSGQNAARQQLTPRQTGAAGTAAAGVPGLPRPGSIAGFRPASSINRSLNNSSASMASPRMSLGATSRAPTAAQSDWQHPQQQQQQSHGYRQLPAGALSQDPVGPTLATYLGTSHAHNKAVTSISSSKSRPSSGVNRAAGAASGRYTPILGSRAPSWQHQQQQRPVSTAAAAAASSKLYSPRLARPSTSSRGRPGSAAHNGQQQQDGAAAGPLLSDYFRPPSAAAPGTVKLFGLPGMDRPGVVASTVPCVRVPSMKTSWDAAAAGLSMDLSSRDEQQDPVVDGAASRDESPSPESLGPRSPAAADGSIHDDGDPQQQMAQGSLHRILSNRVEGLPNRDGPFHNQRPASRGDGGSTGAMSQQQQQQQSPGLDGDAAGQPQLLLWSAAHEIDGRPVTRNGERMGRPGSSSQSRRPSSRGLACA